MSALRPEIAALFPACVRGAQQSSLAEAGPLYPEEETTIARAVGKRRTEFTLGRGAAREALAALGLPPMPLIARANRSVARPPEAWGSITHADGLCAAVVAPRAQLAGIGIDAEVKDRVEQKLWYMIATEREQARLAEPASEEARRIAATLLFSAKEAFYKAQFCVSEAWVGFQDAEVEFDRSGRFALRLLVDVGGAFTAGTRIEGRYALLDRHVVTGLVIASR
jgi:4'-phosphopantetheinyl transferase EntD